MRWVITGANRGIGAEFVRQLAARGDQVDAGARDPAAAKELSAIAAGAPNRVRVHALDVSDDASARAFAASLGDVSVDVLVNNAGIAGKMGALNSVDSAEMLRTYDVNALGPLRVTRALLPHLRRGSTRRIVQITSGMGSIADNTRGGAYGYRMSKAALNMANKSLSIELQGEGFTCIVMNPGWVKTDLGGQGAAILPDESVGLMLGLIDALRPDQTGTFLSYRGNTYPY